MAVQTIGLFEAKTHLSELVAKAEQGDEVIITRHNKPVARIVPMASVAPFDREQRLAAVASLRAWGEELRQRGVQLTTEEVVGWIREGREERTERILDAALPPKGAE